MSAYLSPVGNEAQIDANGNPLSGGKIFTYLAGTTTLAATYTSSTAGTPQSNPIILNSHGLPTLGPIWLGAGVAIKMVFTDSVGASARPTVDNILGVNDPSGVTAQDQWVTFTSTATYISATSFSVAGDQTGTFQVGRRVKTTNSGGTVYSTVYSSTFGAVTTVVLVNDSGTLDAGLSAVSYGLLTPTSPSVPATYLRSMRGYIAALTMSTAGSSATLSVAAGECADSTNAAVLRLGSTIAKTTSAWAVGSGNGGLDTGAIANSTWYHFYVIGRTDSGLTDVVFSTNVTTPTLPSGYTQYRRIGSARTNGSAQWTKFIQDWDFFQWDTPVLDVSATAAGSSAVTRTLTVPTGINVRAFLNAGGQTGPSGEAIYLSDLATADLAPGTVAPLATVVIPVSLSSHVQALVRTNTSGQIRSRQNIGGASDTLRIATLGWYDTRGRDA